MSRGLALLFAAVVLLAAGAWQSGAVSGPALPVLSTLGGDFRMASTLAPEASLREFNDQIVLLNFGFTSCPHVCPMALARMRDTIDALPDGQTSVRPVFVTLDPQRDTIERMQSFLARFGDSFVGFTGSPEQIGQAATAYKVYYETNLSAADDNDSISHSSQIYLIDRQGRTRATFGQSVTVPQIIATVQQLLEETS